MDRPQADESWDDHYRDERDAAYLYRALAAVEADRERKVILELVQLPHFAPTAGFADRVMAQVKVPTPSDSWKV